MFYLQPEGGYSWVADISYYFYIYSHYSSKSVWIIKRNITRNVSIVY